MTRTTIFDRDVTADDGGVIAVVQVDANLARFARIESTTEVSCCARLELHIDESTIAIGDRREIGGVRRVNIHHPGELQIKLIGDVAQSISATPKLRDERWLQRAVLRRRSTDRRVDDGVRDALLECGRDRVPCRLLETDEQTTIECSRIARERHDARIRGVERREVRLRPSRPASRATHRSCETHGRDRERQAPSARPHRRPNRAHFQLPRWRSTSPMMKSVSRASEERALVDAVCGQTVEQRDELFAVDDVGGAGEPGSVIGLRRVLLDHAEVRDERLAMLAQQRVVRHDGELGRRVR